MYQPKSDASASLTPLDPRIRRRCEAALAKVINAFPDILAQCQPETAAAIIARLIHIVMCRPHIEGKEDPLIVLMKTLEDMEQRELQCAENV